MPTLRFVTLAGCLAAALLAGGCSDLESPAAAREVSHNALVSELAATVTASGTLTYTATYQLPQGRTGTIAQAQRPARIAYRYPGGTLLLGPAGSTHCAATTCTRTAKPTATEPVPAALVADAESAGLVTASTIAGLLNAAAADPDATIAQSDTTIAQRHATCVDVGAVDNAATSTFRTCVTSDGVVGSFRGILHGEVLDVAMTGYRDSVSPNAFDLPSGARVVDRR